MILTKRPLEMMNIFIKQCWSQGFVGFELVFGPKDRLSSDLWTEKKLRQLYIIFMPHLTKSSIKSETILLNEY